jgi:hypothetical protein
MFTDNHKKLLDKLTDIDKVEIEIIELLKETKKTLDELKNLQSDIDKIIAEKSKGFPWLADRIAEYYELRDLSVAEYLEKKFRPAQSTADRVRELAKEKRILRKEFLIAKNFVNYYENLFPWLTDYVGENLDDLIRQIEDSEKTSESEEDPVFQFVPKAEYNKLSEGERNQIALDRYFASRKHPWEIGRDYERYIGYLYEMEGYDVKYQGIEKGLEDLGRDLICKKNGIVDIIQCKYWAQHKTIHEKHINQLFGTSIKYYIDFIANEKKKSQLSLYPELLKEGNIKATFITSTRLSETAMQFAQALGINIKENFGMKKYPVIKCNISANGNKIYHLPFDQQYDNTKISKNGECYVMTVNEAERLGFRRAWKWQDSGINK